MRINCTVKRGKSCGDRSAVWWVLWRGRDVRGMPFCKRVGTLRARPDGQMAVHTGPSWLAPERLRRTEARRGRSAGGHRPRLLQRCHSRLREAPRANRCGGPFVLPAINNQDIRSGVPVSGVRCPVLRGGVATARTGHYHGVAGPVSELPPECRAGTPGAPEVRTGLTGE